MGLVEFMQPYIKQDNAEYLARTHYSMRGNLTMNGWVLLGKRKEDDNFSIAVGDHPGQLTFWNQRDKLKDEDRVRWNAWLKLAGANHRRRVIQRVSRALGCTTQPMEEIKEDQLKMMPDSLIKVERGK